MTKNMKMLMLSLFVLTIVCGYTLGTTTPPPISSTTSPPEPSFKVDYVNKTFLKDGKPFRYISGTMHYFRVPNEYWEDRLLKMRAAGLNAIQTYVEWNTHEPEPGQYRFSGDQNVTRFIQLAHEIGFLVLIRPGPYIDAERDMGGLPYWLLSKYPNIKLRSMDQNYTREVDKWYSVLLPKLEPLLYKNGGPIIGLQVENEYGSYDACDYAYTNHLRDTIRSYVGEDIYLYSTDGNSDGYLKCGKVPGVYATVDFGCGSNVSQSFAAQRNHEPWGPNVNSEFYTGWLDHWGYPHAFVSPACVLASLNEILKAGASVNLYVFIGGTSFGFTSGSNGDKDSFLACPTSYDYDAPLTENGDTTAMYYVIRDVIQDYTGTPLPPVPPNQPRHAYGVVDMNLVAPLLEIVSLLSPSPPIDTVDPVTFESVNQSSGFILYSTVVKGRFMVPANLQVAGISDRGYVFINGRPSGILSRQDKITVLPVSVKDGDILSLLVENQGRLCYGSLINDFKGIIGDVIIGSAKLKNWTQILLPFNDVAGMEILLRENSRPVVSGNTITLTSGSVRDDVPDGPALYSGSFVLKEGQNVSDTFLKLDGWNKGVAFINGFNLGRYWPPVGPQITLYVPKTVILPNPHVNVITLLEQEASPCAGSGKCVIEFTDEPEVNGETPYTVDKSPIKEYAGSIRSPLKLHSF